MGKRKVIIILLAWAVMVTFCTFCRFYGPFFGKVVDANTSEPIAGAVVLIGFHTKGSSVGGWVWSFADAVETLTDDNGEFHFPPKFVYSFRALAVWDEECDISIFKPGYGAYPGHPKTFCLPDLEQPRVIPENEHITYYLPKLATLEEKKKNLMKIESPAGIPEHKKPLLRKLENEEYKNVFGS